ncbi:sn-glycerol-1-phosphate dehydrogenase [Vulcanisaeta distributa]|uniref:Glycerol-1-phosphate dehydrogenase [NAD(P)+] n=1 Tax=Vulcanisaeta distributa (strain DSM 14429 / JCM 11212 / NBRC 100878 / IC-017) TaxID=572478 RepID=E1QR48_VULDI|nr:sn-glycerol-1-phosphate dehydrogenase [Vulcanisaeta distributa]ADN51738.1 3-dehydroquinate synthase [Vulcanisaeta distributa DSM 14429]
MASVQRKSLEMYEIPRVVVFGPNAISKVPEILSKIGLDGLRGLILIGPHFGKHLIEKIECRICDVEEVDEISPERIIELSNRYAHVTDYIIALGGGRIIDFGKAMAYMMNVPYVSIPTIASHDGIASPYVSHVLQLDLNKHGVGKVQRSPIAIIADTSIILEAPRRYLLAGIGELVGKLIAVKDWELAVRVKGEEFSEYAAALAKDSALIVLRNRDRLKVHNEESVRIVVKALLGCGVAMAIAGSSRPCSGSEHLFSHAIDLLARERGFRPALHGEQVALGAIMMAYLHGMRWRRIRSFLQSLNIPVTAKELGLDREIIIEALTIAHNVRPDRFTILGAGLTRKAAENLVEITGVA